MSQKKFFERFMPDPDFVREHKSLQILGSLIHSPQLWHLNRRSVARAFLVGIFCAFIPIPFQMVVAAIGAIIIGANLPISVGLVWLTNPVTMPIIFGTTLLLGFAIMGTPEGISEFRFEWDWLSENWLTWLDANWTLIIGPLFLGSMLAGAVLCTLSYFGIRLYWRIHVGKQWQHRKNQRQSQQD